MRLAKVATTSGFQNIAVILNMASVGGPIAGDFSMQIDFSDAIIGPGVDQVELHSYFADSSFFFDVYDNTDNEIKQRIHNS